MIDTIGALVGLIGGALLGCLGLYIGNKQAKRHRGLDERFVLIPTKARASSWIVMHPVNTRLITKLTIRTP
ncbi:hypothetical protein BRE01_60620 [Brevibacillus reuszeri]|uniref:Uncharacterized protein n=1 Tax=Brevibacillus reuszeri TaxID=54915 RepID=A0A0K9YZ61_9BACL|nr:hypothetical protein ADS79_08725 [Brevibacillus reuszeri]GED72360.1 hypothetical protein BRE01_60620 [Brevibacillus reuszeri]